MCHNRMLAGRGLFGEESGKYQSWTGTPRILWSDSKIIAFRDGWHALMYAIVRCIATGKGSSFQIRWNMDDLYAARYA